MSLQIRRGTDSQRSSIVFDQGEITWTTDTNKLFIGDGITAGGINVIASAAGTGLSWNSTTNTLNFTGTGLGLTTSQVTESVGGPLYFTTVRAQQAAAALFTSIGTATTTGNITGTIAPNEVTVSSTTGMTTLIPFTVAGNGSGTGGLTNGTYYITSIVDSTHITVSSSLANAQSGIAVSSLTTASLSGVTFSAGGGSAGDVTFVYNQAAGTVSANVNLNATGLVSVYQDPNPTLGGNLTLNSHNIVGSGNISLTSGGVTLTSGGVTLTSGNIGITSGNITVSAGTISVNSSITAGSVITNSISGTSSTVVLSSSTQTPFALNSIGATGTVSSGTVPVLALNGSRGTIASPTNTAAGDYIHGINFAGFYNSAYVSSGSIFSSWDASAVLTYAHPSSSLSFVTGNNSASYNTMVFNSNAILSGIAIQLNAYPTGSYPTPSAGMMIFDSTTKHFYGYNGTSWVAFTGP